jgi:hypothetical protein
MTKQQVMTRLAELGYTKLDRPAGRCSAWLQGPDGIAVYCDVRDLLIELECDRHNARKAASNV